MQMNFIQNIWNHPKTSAAGLLIAVATVAGVLSQQGITLGRAGTGTVVTLVGALATALLGLLAKDPGNVSQPVNQKIDASSSRPAKLGVLLLAALLTAGTLPATGCSASEVNKVVNQIDTYLPTVVSLLNEALTIYSSVSVSGTNSKNLSSALALVSADLKNLEVPISGYLSATSSSAKTTAWSNIQALVDSAVNDSDTLLTVARVSDPASRQNGTVVITTLDAAIHAIDAFVTSAQSRNEVQAKLAKRSMKIAAVQSLWSDSDRRQIAAATGTSYPGLLRTAEQMGF